MAQSPNLSSFQTMIASASDPAACNQCNGCGMCRIVRMFLIHKKCLQERLKDLQHQYNNKSSVLQTALDEARHHQQKTNTELTAEKSQNDATHSDFEKLCLENRTLWALVNDLASVPGGGESVLAMIQELYDHNKEQETVIWKQHNKIGNLRVANAAMKKQLDGCYTCQNVADIEDDHEDYEVVF
ncbi:hypothetical protein ACJ73_04546 [Blastomyces percursus]|uniref:Uncharacterized protein n=1 Tax=Blastomyces percursus TaxID=1658174 RepID=A0A1J9Q5T9_9EURO|nr:hypothetical protein ACJ73_04546 [Blastomyces percursus]